MPVVKVRQLGSLGIVKDVLSSDLPPEAWTDSRNCVFENGYVAKAKGQRAVQDNLPDSPWFVISSPHPPEGSIVGSPNWVFSDTNRVYATVTDLGTLVTSVIDITPSAGELTGNRDVGWLNGGWFNGIFVLNNRFAPPMRWTIDEDTILEPLENFSISGVTDLAVDVMRPFGNFLVGLGVWERVGGDLKRFATHILWSHPADPGEVPPSWDVTDATKLAGRLPLGTTAGPLIDCLPLGTANMVYKLDASIRMERIASNSIFSFREISRHTGLIAQDALVNLPKGRQAFLTSEADVVITDGHQITSIIDEKNRRFLEQRIRKGNEHKSFLVADYRERQLYICYNSIRQVGFFCDEAMVWNWKENTWAVRELDDCLSGESGPIRIENPQDQRLGYYRAVIGFTDPPHSLRILNENYTDHGNSYTSWVERTGLTIAGQDSRGNIALDPVSVKHISKLWPLITCDEDAVFTISVGVHEHLQGPIVWQNFTYTANQDLFVEPLITGRFIAIKVLSNSDAAWKLHGYDIEVNIVGTH